MGFLDSRSMTLTEFRVSGPLPTDHRVRFVMDIERCAFASKDDVGEAELVCGWTRPGQAFEPPTEQDLFAGSYLLLSFRMDRRSVPARLLKHRSVREADRLMRERGVERLSRREKREIRDRVHASLLKQTLPGIRVFDVVWHLDGGRVLFTGSGQHVCNLFTELFERSFGLSLTRETLKSRTERVLLDATRQKAGRRAG